MIKVPKADRATYNDNPSRNLANRERAVYLAHIAQHRDVNHAVVVVAERRFIINSEEKYPLTLIEGVLRKCGRKEANKLQIEDLHCIIDHAKSNPSNHRASAKT